MVIQSCSLTITPAEMPKLSVTWLDSSSDHMIDGLTDWLAFGAKYSENHWSMLSFHVWSTDAWYSIKSSVMKRRNNWELKMVYSNKINSLICWWCVMNKGIIVDKVERKRTHFFMILLVSNLFKKNKFWVIDT